MTKEQGLEALKTRSAAALRQQDLVGLAVPLALNETPSKAYRTTLAHGWPERLAKSVQSLATLRRDHGAEVLRTFISSFEHARSLIGETEHAQEKRMSRERQLRSIAKLSSPAQKLKLMVKHGLTEDAEALLDELLAQGEVSFWFSSNSATYPVRLCDRETEEYGIPDSTVYVLFCPKGVTPPDSEPNPISLDRDRERSVTVILDELAEVLNWDLEKKRSFVRKALEVLAKRDQVYRHHDCSNATALVSETYLDADDELKSRVDLIVLRTRFRESRVYDLGRYYPVETSGLPARKQEGDAAISRMLERAIELFREFGLDEEQVRQEFLWWLRHRPGTWPSWILCFARASCFSDPEDEDRYQALRGYLPEAWKFAITSRNDEWTLEHVARLGPYGLFRKTTGEKQGDEDFFRTELTALLSEGKAGKVLEAITSFGDVAGLNPELDWSEGNERQAAAECMHVLAPAAFRQAFDADRFGIAAALTRQFRCFPQGVRDRTTEVFQLAEDLDQEIELQAAFDLSAAIS